METDVVRVHCSVKGAAEIPSQILLSRDLYDNIIQTSLHLHYLIKCLGISKECFWHLIQSSLKDPSALEKIQLSTDPYSTGLGKNLHNLQSNVW